MPAHRKSTVLGRSPGRDRAGATLASMEAIERWCRLAEQAGLNVNQWYRDGIVKLQSLARRPITRADIDEMAEVQEAMQIGFDEAGINSDGLIPHNYKLYDLQWRTAEHRANVLVEWH
jgi:hypothetical protein